MSDINSTLKVKDEEGNWVGLAAIKGDPGESGIVVTDEDNDGNVVIAYGE